MMPVPARRWWTLAAGLAAVVVACAGPMPRLAARDLPARLSDEQFWRFIEASSEPGGTFRAANITNLTSNEARMQWVIPDLVRRTRPGGVYLGVGPEQNFTYITAVRPAMAFIVDIRRGNLDLQLMYKAIFELSEDRADFVATLFSVERPAGLRAEATADELFRAFALAPRSDRAYQANLARIEALLTRQHGLPLPDEDLAGIREVYRLFYTGLGLRLDPTYPELMTATDQAGVSWSYLATESKFMQMKVLESRNLVVPLVGNFAGPTAIRAVGRYVSEAGGRVSAFYLSNVEQYLDGAQWAAFCHNVSSLPLDETTAFIRSQSGGGFGGGFLSSLGAAAEEVRGCSASR
jgi:hypothetical protein